MTRFRLAAVFAIMALLSLVGVVGAQSTPDTKQWSGTITGSGAGAADRHPVTLPADADVMITLTQTQGDCIGGHAFYIKVEQNGSPLGGNSAEVAACKHVLTVHSPSGGAAVAVVENYQPRAVAGFTVSATGLAGEESTPGPSATPFATPSGGGTIGRGGR